jgi:micrococcal nuclease
MNPHIYRADITRVVDGDTCDVTLHLGFDILYKGRVRLTGIDTPESRTRDLVEKKFGLASKQYFKDWAAKYDSVLVESTEKGKFGRILGRIYNPDMSECYNDKSIEDHHAVVYNGENKDLVEQQHMDNRIWLTEQGMVV